jgi:hypothetical protein
MDTQIHRPGRGEAGQGGDERSTARTLTVRDVPRTGPTQRRAGQIPEGLMQLLNLLLVAAKVSGFSVVLHKPSSLRASGDPASEAGGMRRVDQ